MRNFNLLIIGLISSVSAHANFQPSRVAQDTEVKVTLNLPHSCTKKYTGLEDSPITSVTIVYPEVLVKNNVPTTVTPLAKIPPAGSSNSHNHGTASEQHTPEIHHFHDTNNSDKVNEHPNHHVDSNQSGNNKHVEQHGALHGNPVQPQHVHRRHDSPLKTGMNITFSGLNADMIDFILAFKTPKLDQLPNGENFIKFKVQQFCKNGKSLNWIPGDEKFPAAQLIILEKDDKKPFDTDPNTSNADLLTGYLITLAISSLYTLLA